MVWYGSNIAAQRTVLTLFSVLLSQYIRAFRNKPAFLQGDDAERWGHTPL